MRRFRFAAAWVALALTVTVAWAEPLAATAEPAPTRFSARLSAAERGEAGLERLTPDQQAALDAQVAREVDLARRGNTIAFAGTFTSRRPSSEQAAAGLDRLTEAERARLDDLVARALAERPVLLPSRLETRGSTAVETVSRRAQWHGEISATYGRTSGGGDFYGGSVTAIYDDPDRGFAAALTLSEYRGDGLFGYGPYDRYGYGYGRGLGPYRWHR